MVPRPNLDGDFIYTLYLVYSSLRHTSHEKTTRWGRLRPQFVIFCIKYFQIDDETQPTGTILIFNPYSNTHPYINNTLNVYLTTNQLR